MDVFCWHHRSQAESKKRRVSLSDSLRADAASLPSFCDLNSSVEHLPSSGACSLIYKLSVSCVGSCDLNLSLRGVLYAAKQTSNLSSRGETAEVGRDAPTPTQEPGVGLKTAALSLWFDIWLFHRESLERAGYQRLICSRVVPVSKPFPVDGSPHAICSKLAPTQGALGSGHRWSDAGGLESRRSGQKSEEALHWWGRALFKHLEPPQTRFQAKTWNICRFRLVKREDLLLFFVIFTSVDEESLGFRLFVWPKMQFLQFSVVFCGSINREIIRLNEKNRSSQALKSTFT